MSSQSNNKTIAKNTMFLYFRMMVTMIIALYTSRVILQVLGVDDYGIYQAVGGIVGFLGFLNAAMSAGTSRFITFGLGEGDEVKLKKNILNNADRSYYSRFTHCCHRRNRWFVVPA